MRGRPTSKTILQAPSRSIPRQSATLPDSCAEPIYVAVGLAVLASIILYANATGRKSDFPVRWVGLVLNTPLVFWLLIRTRRDFWRTALFWAAIGALFVLHSAVYTVLLLKVDQWPLVWFVPCVVVEVLVFSVALNSLFPPWKRMTTRKHGSGHPRGFQG
jgi:hypothetical protein